MPEAKAMIDHRVDEIHALTDRLQKCLLDAERVRARFTKALERDSWPDVQGVMARLLAASDPADTSVSSPPS